jgi:hypothetical protein
MFLDVEILRGGNFASVLVLLMQNPHSRPPYKKPKPRI